MKSEFANLIKEHILLYYIIHLENPPSFTFKKFADRAYIKGTDILAIGATATEERRQNQYRVRNLKVRLAKEEDPTLLLPSDFRLEVCWLIVVYSSS